MHIEHIAFSIGSKEAVDELTEKMKIDIPHMRVEEMKQADREGLNVIIE